MGCNEWMMYKAIMMKYGLMEATIAKDMIQQYDYDVKRKIAMYMK